MLRWSTQHKCCIAVFCTHCLGTSWRGFHLFNLDCRHDRCRAFLDIKTSPAENRQSRQESANLLVVASLVRSSTEAIPERSNPHNIMFSTTPSATTCKSTFTDDEVFEVLKSTLRIPYEGRGKSSCLPIPNSFLVDWELGTADRR